MLRSYSEEQTEFDAIKLPKHVATVWAVIDATFDEYWKSLVAHNPDADKYDALLKKFSGKPKKPNRAETLRRIFSTAITDYEEEAARYRTFFDEECLQEFQDHDQGGFKRALERECPIIRTVLRSTREELKDWKYKFRNATGQELLDTFSNLVGFANEYAKRKRESNFQKLDRYRDFGLDALDDDEDYRIQGVIGSGIKSCVLHHLSPRFYPVLNRRSMYGLYFLSKTKPFGLPSDTSEFLMINDTYEPATHGIRMDHNYWYPYGLLTLYAMRLYRKMEEKSVAAGVTLDSQYRFVYVSCLFDEIWQCHEEAIATMMCVDERDMK